MNALNLGKEIDRQKKTAVITGPVLVLLLLICTTEQLKQNRAEEEAQTCSVLQFLFSGQALFVAVAGGSSLLFSSLPIPLQ